MTDMLADATAWLSGVLQVNTSRRVLYQRGDDWCEFDATIGRTLLRIDDADGGSRLVWTDADLIFPASLLVLGSGEPALPQRGDRATIYFGSQQVIHEVLTPGAEPEYKWSDPGRTILRVHTKRVGVGT